MAKSDARHRPLTETITADNDGALMQTPVTRRKGEDNPEKNQRLYTFATDEICHPDLTDHRFTFICPAHHPA